LVRSRIFPIGNICALCEETYPSSALYKCHRCGIQYCGNCVILDENGKITCLRCAVKSIFPRGPKSKYSYLSVFLAKKGKFHSEITLSFTKIENIIGEKLPESAYEHKQWWSNVRNRSPSEYWLTVGWRVKEVNLKAKTVTFLREEKLSAKEKRTRKGRRKKKPSSKFRTLAIKARINFKRRKKPSKSKIAILQARLKNLERRRYTKRYRNKSLYEKRFYRLDEEP